MSTLAKNASYPAGQSAPNTTITPGGPASGITAQGKSGVSNPALFSPAQQSATSIATSRPISDGALLNYVRSEDDATYRGNAAGYSLLGE